MSKKNVSAATVRAWGRENLSSIAPAGHACLGETARGRLHPEVVKAFAKANKGRKGYEPKVAEGATIVVAVKGTDAKGRNITRKREVSTVEARALLGHPKGKVGRISKAALAAALADQS